MLRTWRFLTMMLTALSMGVALCHLLQMPAQLVMQPAQWLAILQTQDIPAFAAFGIWFEVGAVSAAIILTLSLRNRYPTYGWTLLATLCLIATHASFWMWIDAINREFGVLTAQTLPVDWQEFRDQWVSVHAARAALQVVALASLVLSVLVETPATPWAGARAKSKWLDQRYGR